MNFLRNTSTAAKVGVMVAETAAFVLAFWIVFGFADAVLFLGLCVVVIGGAIFFIPLDKINDGSKPVLRPHRWWRADDGSASIEWSLVALPFLALLVGPITVLLVFLSGSDLQRAADLAAYRMKTGAIAVDVSAFQTAVCDSLIVVACEHVAFESDGPAEIGDGDQFAVFSATYTPTFLPDILARKQVAVVTPFTLADCQRFRQCIGE